MSEMVHALAGHTQPGIFGTLGEAGPAVTLAEVRPAAVLQVGAWPQTRADVESTLTSFLGLSVPEAFGMSSGDEATTVMTLGPGRYMIVSADAGIREGLKEQLDAEKAAITDLGHARTVLRISGLAATKVLRKGLTLDLDPGTFPERAVAQTAVHHIGTLVHRREAEVFDLFVFRGFALSFWEWLTDASLEYGYRVADPL